MHGIVTYGMVLRRLLRAAQEGLAISTGIQSKSVLVDGNSVISQWISVRIELYNSYLFLQKV